MRTAHFLVPITVIALLAGNAMAAAAAWPRVPGQGTDWFESLSEPQWPTIAGDAQPAAAGGPKWRAITNEIDRRFPSAYAFEIGARYWYSSGTTKFGFSNGATGFGSPTSALDWNDTKGHSGELFARLDHRPTGLFVKATAGAGILRGGEFVDRDYLMGQFTFSDTTSEVHGDNLRFATVDVGVSYEVPRYGVRLGGFVGYHYWHEKTTAYGLVCNATDYVWNHVTCGPPGMQLYGNDTAVLVYEPTWHALRIGADAQFRINDRWSVSGEAALIPFALLENKDSHLLRQSMSDLGPAPNVISKGYGWGGMAEIFVNYAVTPNIQAGLGLRYWGINAYKGDVTNGPSYDHAYQLDYFDMSRFGLLAQIKGTF